jgi:hypothetical protein
MILFKLKNLVSGEEYLLAVEELGVRGMKTKTMRLSEEILKGRFLECVAKCYRVFLDPPASSL